MKKRKFSKSPNFSKTSARKWMTCRVEGCYNEVSVGADAVSVKCSKCMQRSIPFPKEDKPKVTGPKKPRGWHWMEEFVDVDGNVFHKGEEQPKLKGTLKPTKIEKKERKSKFQRNKENVEKEAKLAKKHQKIKRGRREQQEKF